MKAMKIMIDCFPGKHDHPIGNQRPSDARDFSDPQVVGKAIATRRNSLSSEQSHAVCAMRGRKKIFLQSESSSVFRINGHAPECTTDIFM